ncbi:MAG: DUF2461 domain-containing protein [Alphaproteobacteria bacterium]|nr:DUF2461 domain-containing protein [Alphaproteobacteria bacterium]
MPADEASAFRGFGKPFFAFFRELADHNERPWFEANKARYREEVVAPMVAFIEAMAPRLARLSPHFVADPRPNGGSMFRIHRDVRFAKDKRPYKEHAACQFRHAACRDAHAPGFYVHLAPDEVIFGGGIWLPEAAALARVRSAIAEDVGGWDKIVRDRRLVATFGGVAGDALKRPPKGFAPEHPHIEDLKRVSFFAMRQAKPAAAAGAGFAAQVADTFADATPLMRFLCRALGQKY